jgi:hypothetical protein
VSVIDVVGVVMLVIIIALLVVGVIGELFDAAWGIGELGADLIDWLRERRDRRPSA